MKKFATQLLVLFAALIFATPAFADELKCSDVGELAKAWTELGTLSEAEVEEHKKDIEELAEATGLLAGMMAESGEANLVKISKEIMGGFDALEKAEDAASGKKALGQISAGLKKAEAACNAE